MISVISMRKMAITEIPSAFAEPAARPTLAVSLGSVVVSIDLIAMR